MLQEKRRIDVVQMGPSAVAICDNILKALKERGLLSQEDIRVIIEQAIDDLEGNPGLEPAADNIRAIFNP